MDTTRTYKDKVRQTADLIRKFGTQVETTRSPESHTEVKDLRGAGRLTVTQAGLRNNFTLEASAAKFEFSCWRGQMERLEVKEGNVQDIERIADNTREITDRIKSEDEIQKKAKRVVAPTGDYAFR